MITGAMCTRKSVNVRSARLAMMMFGGSPTSVAAPPMLDANASASRNGTGAMPSCRHTEIVRGAISRTVVTLSRRADAPAVTRTSRTSSFRGRPPASLAEWIARYSKAPVRRRMPTTSIIPRSRKMTSQSIPVSGE